MSDAARKTISNLAIAPDAVRCSAMVVDENETVSRCNRYSLRVPGGGRERMCISHSRSGHAEDLRRDRRRAQINRMRKEAAAREKLAYELLPAGLETPTDLLDARVRIGRAVVEGRISPGQANALRGIVADLERARG